jgi:prepilin-type N-terminal cleavage/methylation domain-containing protein
MKKQMGFTAIELIVVIVVLLGAGGWIANIVKIIGTVGDLLTVMFIARCLGVFMPPLGAVLGFF